MQFNKETKFNLTDRSSLPVMARGFVGWTAKAHSSPSQCPCIIRKGLLRSCTTISKISLSCVPTSIWSPLQQTLLTERPVEEIVTERHILRTCKTKVKQQMTKHKSKKMSRSIHIPSLILGFTSFTLSIYFIDSGILALGT